MGRDVYKLITPTVTDLSSVSDTKVIVPNTFIGSLRDFGVTVVSSATQVVAYRIQFSPIDKENMFITAGTGQTSTSVAAGSGTLAKTHNVFSNNFYGYLRIEASAGSSIADSPIAVYIHGVREE
jgi:hypothetical protein